MFSHTWLVDYATCVSIGQNAILDHKSAMHASDYHVVIINFVFDRSYYYHGLDIDLILDGDGFNYYSAYVKA